MPDVAHPEQVVQTDSFKKVENFIRNSNNFKKLFSEGIEAHTNYFKSRNKTGDTSNLTGIESVLGNYKKLNEVIKSGFSGFVARKKDGDLSSGWAALTFCQAVDVNPNNSKYLNLSTGPKVEYVVNINKLEGLDHESGRSPEVILDSKGYRIEVYSKAVKKSEYGEIITQPFDGFVVFTNCSFRERKGGEKSSIGKATKFNPVVAQDSHESYVFEQNSVCDLAKEIDQLQVFK